MTISASRSRLVAQTLEAMASIQGRELTPHAVALLLSDLAPYSEQQVLAAIAKFRRESNRFPMTSDIIAHLPGEHPGAEEAWSLVPRDETSSTFWTDEIALAWGQVRELARDDDFAARMAFKEIYERLVGESRVQGKKAVWRPSFGHDAGLHQVAVERAVALGRITQEEAKHYLPAPVAKKEQKQIQGSVEPELKPLSMQETLERARAMREKLQEAKE